MVYKRTQNKDDGQKGGGRDENEYTSVFLVLFIYFWISFIFRYLIAYQPMEISDFPWLPLEFVRVFSILTPPHRSRMRSHVLLVTDLIDPYLSPRCFTQNMVLSWGFFISLIPLWHWAPLSSRSYPWRGVHNNNTPLAVVTHNTLSSGAGCVATHK